MSVEVHVEGRVLAGLMPRFAEAVEQYKGYARTHDYAVPKVLMGLSGEMNTVRLVYRFGSATEYEEQEVRTLRDEAYGAIAGQMGFAEGTLRYSVYREI